MWVIDAALWNSSFKLSLYGGVVSEGGIGFASLDVVSNELNDSTWDGGLQ